MIQRLIPILALAMMATLLPAGGARADAIDGDWCHSDGRHLSIDGPRIVTPGGTRMEGVYLRHAFSYTVPAAEPGAGSAISMTQLSEDTMHLTTDTAPTRVQVWHRCELSIS